jgi:hypothetical protein
VPSQIFWTGQGAASAPEVIDPVSAIGRALRIDLELVTVRDLEIVRATGRESLIDRVTGRESLTDPATGLVPATDLSLDRDPATGPTE